MTTISTVSLHDLEKIVPLFDAYRVFYEKPSDPDGARQFLQARIQHNESVIFWAEHDGLPCGFVQLYPLFSSTRMKRLWLLNDLFVHADYRGRGISVALIDRCKTLCRDTAAAGLMLETAKTNDIGNQLYPRTGFDLDQDHNYYFWNGEWKMENEE